MDCCCPPPRRPPTHRSHHHEADALDALDVHTKTTCLYKVPNLKNYKLIFSIFWRDGGTTDGVTYTIRWSRINTAYNPGSLKEDHTHTSLQEALENNIIFPFCLLFL